MLPLDAKVTFDASQLTKALKDLATRGGNVGNVMPVIAEDICTEIINRFELQSGYEQGKWQDDKPATIAARRVSKSPKILEDSGVLLGSITPYDDGETAEGYTNVPYAKYHVSPEPRKIIPLRDFTDIDFGSVSDRAMELILSEVAVMDGSS
jgi:phage gpG-like protein